MDNSNSISDRLLRTCGCAKGFDEQRRGRRGLIREGVVSFVFGTRSL